MLLGFALSAAQAQVLPNAAPSAGISFSSLSSMANFSLYSGHTEGDFTITPTAGSWYVSKFRGTPAPSIFVGPTNAPVASVIYITDSAGPFRLSSFDYSSNYGDSTYHIQWFVGDTIYDEIGILFNTEYDDPPFSFRTLTTSYPDLEADSLYLTIIPGAETSSINLDTIMVQTVPEPGALWLLGLPLALLVYRHKAGPKA